MVITLLTDFGDWDSYVAAMKGVILGINPQATLVDISHHIEPQNISQAAFLLHTVHKYFPRGTIHLVVVDPGVGTGRRAILLTTPQAHFVALDNGVLSYIIEEKAPPPPGQALRERGLPPGLQAVNLTNTRYWLHPVSTTFHGRDILAPVAAHLSTGIPPQEFGEAITSLLTFPLPHPQPQPDGSLVGHIQHIDAFGNLITDLRREDLPTGRMILEIAGRTIEGLSANYAEGEEILALLGSSGYVEIAARNGSAARLLAAHIRDKVRLKKTP